MLLPDDEPRSIEPRDPEVPVEVSLWALPLWPDVEPLLPKEPVLALEPLWPELLPGLVLELVEPVFGLFCPDVEPLDPGLPNVPVPVEELLPLWPYVEPLALPGLALEVLEPALGLFWPEVDDVLAWPLRSLPIDDVSVDEPVLAVAPPVLPLEVEPVALPDIPLVEPVALPGMPLVEPLAEPCMPLVEPLADPCAPLVEPCVATWPWLPAALWVPSTVPCVLVPVVDVFDAVRVSLLDPEHAASSAAAPSAPMK
ncbi:MAG: hypothetical protein ACJ79H_02770 [Myxococcales bacterium]